MRDFMFSLAENYQLGIYVSSGVVIAVYILVSVLSAVTARKRGIDVSLGAMIPLWNIKYFFSKPK